MKTIFSRRQILRGLALGTTMGASTSASSAAHAAKQVPSASSQPPGVCTLFPQATEGPYYFDPKLVRSDITEGRPGMPVQLVLRLVEGGPCTPIAGMRVDVWHADADGIYSGYTHQGDSRDVSAKGETYLRGTQMTDTDGQAVFQTLYPGWYPGRTPHIHLKAFLDQATVLTAQIYFPDALSARIYRERRPYASRPVPDTTNKTDGIFQAGEHEGGGTVLAIEEQLDLIRASLLIAVDQTGEAARRSSGWGGFLRNTFGR